MSVGSWSDSTRKSPLNPAGADVGDVGHRLGRCPRVSENVKSELEPQTELHDARIVRPIQYQEPAASRVGPTRQRLHR